MEIGRIKMIVSCLGYGYISVYLLKEISSNGIKCLGVTDNEAYLKKPNLENISIIPRSMTEKAIKQSTHLVITAPPDKKSCPILSKYKEQIKNSNIRSIVYISSTGVYGDHKGKWVNENSLIKGKNIIYNKYRIEAEKKWIDFSKNTSITLNIVRLGAIYGPKKPNIEKNFFKDILNKKNHFFSRVHVFDISRLITTILFCSNKSNCWNIVDDLPSTRENFVLRIIKLKKVKNYNFISYDKKKVGALSKKRKFWEANKKVSNKKIKKKFEYSYLFPTYSSGLKYTIKNS